MSEAKVKKIKLSELIPDPQNANKGTERGRYMLEHSISTLGAGRSVLVDKNNLLIAGNKTTSVAFESGFEDAIVIETDGSELVVVRRTDLDLTTDSKAKQLAIADNVVGKINLDLDAEIILEIDKEVDLSAFFTDDELNQLSLSLDDDGEGDRAGNDEDNDKTPDESNIVKRVTRGQLWEIAGHRLLCGDCRNSDDVNFLIGDIKINVTVTSPPYASQRKYDEESGFKPIHPDEYVEWFEPIQANIKKHLADDGSYFLNIKEHMDDGERHIYVLELLLALRKRWGWAHIDTFAWTHQGFPISIKTRFKNQWEPIYHLGHTHKIKPINFESVGLETSESQIKTAQKYKEGYREPHRNSGFSDAVNNGTMMKEYDFTRPGNVLKINNGAVGEEYRIQSAGYPIALPEFFIKAFSDESDRVYDPFLGSGTTMVASHRNNRIGLGMEISEKYCNLILSRMQELTGVEPKLIGTMDDNPQIDTSDIPDSLGF